jgi:hypothetical protein
MPRLGYLPSAVARLPPRFEISKRAGVAEGTRFTYFKNALTNSLYREIKLELADPMMSDFPGKKEVRTRLQHVWNRYVNWGTANPEHRKVLAQLQVSDIRTKDSRAAGSAPFIERQTMIRDVIEQRVFRDDRPVELVSKPLGALAEATMDLMMLQPTKAQSCRDSGFQMYWASITK